MTQKDDGLQRPRPWSLIGLAFAGLLAGILLGAATNAVNGRLSPHYFISMLGWDDVLDVPSAAIAQGVLEGAVLGAGLGVFFAAVVGLVSRAACPFRLAATYLLGVVAGALCCWTLGGLLAVGIAALSPEIYQARFPAAPPSTSELMGYAWVGGSICGVELGGLACVVLAAVLFRALWQTQAAKPEPQPRTTVWWR